MRDAGFASGGGDVVALVSIAKTRCHWTKLRVTGQNFVSADKTLCHWNQDLVSSRFGAAMYEVVTKLRSGDRKGRTQLFSLMHSGFGIVRFVAAFDQA
jgi:hypothetical protein